jgi:sugar-phosphatase
MPGVPHIFDFFASKQFKIGLATSSPPSLIDLVVQMTGIESYLSATASAEYLPYGKPHPQVYLNCAESMNSHPIECICFEDSFNGLIAAKAARMKCVVIPHHSLNKDARWGAADLKLSSLQNFGELHFDRLNS